MSDDMAVCVFVPAQGYSQRRMVVRDPPVQGVDRRCGGARRQGHQCTAIGSRVHGDEWACVGPLRQLGRTPL